MQLKWEFANSWKELLHLFHFFGRKNIMRTHPVFESSFIQYWFCQDWTTERWLQEYQMLQKVGISEIILQSVADTKARYAVYPTQKDGYSTLATDTLEIALSAADSIGMKVRIGLGFNDEWWTLDTHDRVWLEQEAEANRALADEIFTLYSFHPSFTGWYIPHEFNPLMAISLDQQANLNQFFQKIVRSIKRVSSHTVMVAPFYNARVSEPVTMALWSYILHHVFKETGVDILALQDSVGAGFNTIEDLDEIYASTRKGIKDLGIALYAVIETFAKNEEENKEKFSPASQKRMEKQLAKVAPYVQGFAAFSLSHYQNDKDEKQAQGYEAYYRYYQNHLKPK